MTRRRIEKLGPAGARAELQRAVNAAPDWQIFGGMLAAMLALAIGCAFVFDGGLTADSVGGALIAGPLALFLGYKALQATVLLRFAAARGIEVEKLSFPSFE
jgi:hypothetical protein